MIAEPDPDLRHLYSIWLGQLGFRDIVITDSGRKCLDEALKITTDTTKIKNSKAQSDIIILDTHLKDIPCIQVAKEIIDRKPDQQIVFTTTLSSDSLIQDISSIGLDNIKEMILTKPFSLSTLMSRIDNSIEGI